MSDAGYISETLLGKLLGEILGDYSHDLVSLVHVPNQASSKTSNTHRFQKVLGFGRKTTENSDDCRAYQKSSALLTGAHHSRELTSI